MNLVLIEILLSIWIVISLLVIAYSLLMIGYVKLCIPFWEEISFDNLELSNDGD